MYSFNLVRVSQAIHSLQVLSCESLSTHLCPTFSSPKQHIQIVKFCDSSSIIFLTSTPPFLYCQSSQFIESTLFSTPNVSQSWSLRFKSSSTCDQYIVLQDPLLKSLSWQISTTCRTRSCYTSYTWLGEHWILKAFHNHLNWNQFLSSLR